ncbi:unnamed protein product [Gulo gulo]|uniref:Uncharacterized protein n=1 Tax=Gulo gulo TaxID=48420 RepID=A0A9X9LR40_GULGU|nr:unnamed protein product [Gulo gulo]
MLLGMRKGQRREKRPRTSETNLASCGCLWCRTWELKVEVSGLNPLMVEGIQARLATWPPDEVRMTALEGPCHRTQLEFRSRRAMHGRLNPRLAYLS